jgi:uncharacterized protein YecE (DUF72 family)
MSKLFVGTSGFAYASWKPDFYPAKLPAKGFLEYYSSRLNCVEINYTFRMLPKLSTLTNWVEATPKTFVFCPKAHMRLTHILKLKGAEAFTELFLKQIDPLRVTGRLGPILFQLAPTFKCDVTLLTEYLKLLPSIYKYAFEFRHASWLNEETYAVLRQRNVALCLAESDTFEVPEVITADFVYFRLRKENYSPEERARIAGNARKMLASGRDLFLFFKHEETPAGALYAEELLSRVEKGEE